MTHSSSMQRGRSKRQAIEVLAESRRKVAPGSFRAAGGLRNLPQPTALEWGNFRVGCLPVAEDGALVGIVTAQDFLAASAQLFKQHLGIRPQAKAQTQR